MNFVFLSWKDIKNPAAGGAELVHQEISKRLVKQGHIVTHLVPGFNDCPATEELDGVKIHRIGSSTLYFYWLPIVFLREYRQNTDYLVDIFNCFGTVFNLFWFPSKKTIFLIHHIQDILWFHQTVFPGLPNWLVPIINFLGYFLEKIQLLIYSLFFKGKVITISNSTKQELQKYGFKESKIEIISEGILGKPLSNLEDSQEKEQEFTIINIGLRKMKRPEHVLEGFYKFQQVTTNVKLWVLGWGTEGQKLIDRSKELGIENKVVFWGRVSDEKRDELLQKSSLLVTTPVKEGWGIIVLEANALGTPALGYNVPGLRDALNFENGWLSQPNINSLSNKLEEIYHIWKDNQPEYNKIRLNGLSTLKKINFDNSTQQFLDIIQDK